jgi:hypothetical protein
MAFGKKKKGENNRFPYSLVPDKKRKTIVTSFFRFSYYLVKNEKRKTNRFSFFILPDEVKKTNERYVHGPW